MRRGGPLLTHQIIQSKVKRDISARFNKLAECERARPWRQEMGEWVMRSIRFMAPITGGDQSLRWNLVPLFPVDTPRASRIRLARVSD